MDEQIQDQPKTSPAKAAVARVKPRDEHGKFLSGAELQQYNAQRQAQQFAAERNKMNSILGRTTPQNPTPGPVQPIPQNNFQNILNANKPGNVGQQNGQPQTEGDKWDILLGKKRQNSRW